MNQEFVDNPLGSEAEADLNLGKGNFAVIFGNRENYANMATEFYKEIIKWTIDRMRPEWSRLLVSLQRKRPDGYSLEKYH